MVVLRGRVVFNERGTPVGMPSLGQERARGPLDVERTRHMSQSWPDPGLVVQATVPQTFQVVSSSRGSGTKQILIASSAVVVCINVSLSVWVCIKFSYTSPPNLIEKKV